MRVLHIIDSLRAGGKERQLTEVLNALAPVRDIVCELVVMSDEMHYDLPSESNVGVHTLVRARRFDVTVFPRLERIVRSFNPYIVQSWDSMCTVFAAPLARWHGARFVNGQIRDARPGLGFTDANFRRAQLTLCLADVVVANSRAGLRAYRIPSHKGIVIHNGYHRDRFVGLANPEDARAELSIDTPFVVGMVASFSRFKDYETYFSAALKILDVRDDVTFLAVGNGSELQKYQRRFEGHPRLRLLGSRTDVERIVNIFDIGILLSTAGEGSPNVVAEYMMLGKPVVANLEGGTPELVIEGTTGYLVACGDEGSVVDRISRLLNDALLAHRLGESGRLRVAKEFSLERMRDAHINLYSRLAKGGSRVDDINLH